MNEFDEQFRDMPHGQHLTFIYDDPKEQLAVICPYMKVGLDRGESCLYMSDVMSEAAIVTALEGYGIDVAHERERGALTIIAARDAYLVGGAFDPDTMIAFLDATIGDVCDRGFTGFRAAAEMSWALSGAPGCELLASYESRISDCFPGKRATGLCQYHRPSFPPSVIRDVLRTHPAVVYDGRVCESLYFEPLDVFHGRCDEEERLAWMLAQTRRSHDARLAREMVVVERSRREAAEASARSKDQFLAMVSHELRTPLTSALAAMWVLKGSELDASGLEAADTLSHSIASQIRLVDDLLDGARIEAGRLSLAIEPVDARFAIGSALDSLQADAIAKGVALVRELHATPILILADPLRVEQIVVNLVANAIKFTPEGGTVRVRLTRDTEGISLVVDDDGAGMDESFVGRAFDRFSQAQAGSTREYNGMGLGLAIVRQLVTLHGGTVVAESAGIGRGSTFTVRLPFVCKHPAAMAVTPRLGDSLPDAYVDRHLQHLRVLVVDDDRDTCAAIGSILKNFVAEVRTASSTTDAMTAASNFRPDVVVTDIAMPGQDGCALLDRLRKSVSTTAIALTAHADPRTENFLLKAGFDFYLRKPVDPMALVKTVAEAGRLTVH